MSKGYGYFLERGNATYVGIVLDKSKYCFKFYGMNSKKALGHIHFTNFITNLDKYIREEDTAVLEDCRKLTEDRWHKDCGLDYQVKEKINEKAM